MAAEGAWVPRAVQQGFDAILAQAPVEPAWRVRQLEESLKTSRVHTRTLQLTHAAKLKELGEVRRQLAAMRG